MKHVYVVRQFFESCNDACYVGVYRDFWAAARGVLAHAEEHFEDYTPKFFTPHKEAELWVLLDDEIYYTIYKMEVE